jgi:Bacterial protein of unknown function (DUF885)
MPDDWLDEFFAAYYRRRPVNATFIGVHDFDDQLPDLSARGQQALADEAKDLLARMPHEPPSVDRELASGFLRIQRWEATSRHFAANPVHFTSEAIFGVVSLLLRERPEESTAARLRGIPAFLAEARSITRAPAAWIDRARRECAGAHLLLADVSTEFPSLRDAAQTANEAFTRFEAFLNEIVQTDAYACGEEALDLLLRYAHFSELDAAGVEQLALDRIAEEEAFLAATPPPPAQMQSSVEGPYLSCFATTWRSACDLARTTGLLTVPEWPVRFVQRPRWAKRAAPYLYFLPYRAPSPFDAPTVVEYLVPPSADSETIRLNHVLHHASWGHHFQNWHAYRSASRIGQIAAVDCASRIAMLCGGTMAEGWANYAVDLAEEAGFLTPSEAYGQHRARIRMAARALVDIRLHQGRFTLQDAVDFYVSRVGMSTEAARAEAVKNSLFPGGACMYLLGWDGIWRLRHQLLPKWPLREFHDRVLSFGSVPVSLIARELLARKESSADVQYASS